MTTKRNTQILSALLAVLLFLSCCPVFSYAELFPEGFHVYYEGKKTAQIDIYIHEKKIVTAENLPEGCGYQWQIQIPGTDTWVDIHEQTNQALGVSYALVGSLLDSKDSAVLRCAAVYEGTKVEHTNALTVTLTEEPEEIIPAPTKATEPTEETAATEETEAVEETTTPTEEMEETTAPAEEQETTAPTEEAVPETTAPTEETEATEPEETIPEAPAETEAPETTETVEENITEPTEETAAPEETEAVEETTAPTEVTEEATAPAVEPETAAPTEETVPETAAAMETATEESTSEMTVPEQTQVEATEETAAPEETEAAEETSVPTEAAVPETTGEAEASDAESSIPEAAEETETSGESVKSPMKLFGLLRSGLADAQNEGTVKESEYVTVTVKFERYDYADDNTTLIYTAPAFTSYVATLQYGASFGKEDNPQHVTFPSLVGYDAYFEGETTASDHHNFYIPSVTKDEEFVVQYRPAKVNYDVRYYFQNTYDDNYVEDSTKSQLDIEGFTGMDPDEDYVKKQFDGFTSLYYEPEKIAADGSTVFEVYYERNYYLMEFDCDGGYGTDTLYIRYETYINVPNPVKSGYYFRGWDLTRSEKPNPDAAYQEDITKKQVSALPVIMPNYNSAYCAIWGDFGANYTVAYWIINADGTRSYLGSNRRTAVVGSTVSGIDDLGSDADVRGTVCNEYLHTDSCYSCGHMHTRACYADIKQQGNISDAELAVIKQLEGGEPEVAFIYTVDYGSNRQFRIYLGTEGWNCWKSGYGAGDKILSGEPVLKREIIYNGTTYVVSKYYANFDQCTEEPNHAHTVDNCIRYCQPTDHVHSNDCYQDTRHMQFVASATDTDKEVKGDGSTVVNVYYEYKTYTLRFYFARTTGGTDVDGDGKPDKDFSKVEVAGGSTYPFGSYSGVNTDDDVTLLKKVGDWGQIQSLPTLKRNPGYVTDKIAVTIGDTQYYYHYISFQARYNENISTKWPCDVFNQATRTSVEGQGWQGTTAFVSAWNGEYRVKYSKDNYGNDKNQTIKGLYQQLDDNLLFDEAYDNNTYTDPTTVSFLCFWENGATIDRQWNVPELYIYNIWLPCIDNKEANAPEGKETTQEGGIYYYKETSYYTCDNSTVAEQTFPGITGFDAHKRTWSAIFMQVTSREVSSEYTDYVNQYGQTPASAQEYIYKLGNDKKYGPGWQVGGFLNTVYNSDTDYYPKTLAVKNLSDSFYSYIVYDDQEYDPDTVKTAAEQLDHTKYREAYNVNFFYTRHKHNLIFWNYDEPLMDGGGAIVEFYKPLSPYGQYVSTARMNGPGWNETNTQTGATRFVDPYPASLEPGAYEFEGWYLSTSFNNAPKVAWNTEHMPDYGFTVYANWVPVEHEVVYYQSLDDLKKDIPWTEPTDSEGNRIKDENGDPLTLEVPLKISHGTVMGTNYVPRRTGYDFLGWFYMENGVKKRFSTGSMEVTQDLYLFAEWHSNTPTSYSVKYVLADGDKTEIAPASEDYITAGKTKTFAAKGGMELDEAYRKGYFPTVNSHSILMAETASNNTFDFEYVYDAQVFYEVRYIDYVSRKALAPAVKKSTDEAIVTERFLPISGYMPQNYYITRSLATDEDNEETDDVIEQNIITFYYTQDLKHGAYSIEFFQENLNSGYDQLTDAQKKDPDMFGACFTQKGSILGQADTGTIIQEGVDFQLPIYEGFAYESALNTKITYTVNGTDVVETKTVGGALSGTVDYTGLTIRVYFLRQDYPYIVEYREYGADENAAALYTDTTGMGEFEASVSHKALDPYEVEKDGNVVKYQLAAGSSKERSITIRAVQDGNENPNKLIFYYVPKQVDVLYKAVYRNSELKEGCSVSFSKESAASVATLSGASAMPGVGFRYVGWFTSEACTEEDEVPDDWIQVDGEYHMLKPKQLNTNLDEVTYYALFEPITLTISQTGLAENETAIYEVVDKDGKVVSTVALTGKGEERASVTIEQIPAGKYTVREITGWTWTHAGEKSQPVTVTADGTNIAYFDFSEPSTDWLHGENHKENNFAQKP